ncbi:MAG: DMT family transporter [Anaerolineales bacterium]
MPSSLLYLIATLIWGSTWLAITFQLGVVPPEMSVVYRFGLASALLFGFARLRGLPLRFTAKQHAFIALEGFLLFSLNYVLVYFAEVFVTSGLVAVVFSTATLFTVFFSAIFLRTKLHGAVVFGSLVGIIGLGIIFLPELTDFALEGSRTLGFLFALLSAISAALGNIVAARNQRNQLPVVQTVAYGMLYGTLLTLLYALISGTTLVFDTSVSYIVSLLYLAIFGSVISFVSYLTLLGRIGPDRSSYIAVIIPVIALVLSAFFEGLRFNSLQFFGVVLVIAGNILVVYRRQKVAVPATAK